MTVNWKPGHRQSAQEEAYERIRDLITSGRFPPGSRLRERDISEMVGYSRTPVREALQRLNSEGLVRSERNRGMFVEAVDLSEVLEVFDIGASLESRCARLAAKRISAANLKLLEETADQMDALFDGDEETLRSRFLDLDTRFHGIVADGAGNRKLKYLARQAISVPVLMISFKSYDAAAFKRSMRQHREILEAIRSGDEEWADVAMRNHILAGRNMLTSASGGS